MVRPGQGSRVSPLSATIKLSTFSKLCSAEAALEQRIRQQRQARLERVVGDEVTLESTPMCENPRLPQRWTDEPL